jgi:hypothetical protein
MGGTPWARLSFPLKSLAEGVAAHCHRLWCVCGHFFILCSRPAWLGHLSIGVLLVIIGTLFNGWRIQTEHISSKWVPEKPRSAGTARTVLFAVGALVVFGAGAEGIASYTNSTTCPADEHFDPGSKSCTNTRPTADVIPPAPYPASSVTTCPLDEVYNSLQEKCVPLFSDVPRPLVPTCSLGEVYDYAKGGCVYRHAVLPTLWKTTCPLGQFYDTAKQKFLSMADVFSTPAAKTCAESEVYNLE